MDKPTFFETIQIDEYIRLTTRKGFNEGGFYQHKTSNQEYYIKSLPENLLENEKEFFLHDDMQKGKYKNRHRNRFVNEFLAIKLYELYGMLVPDTHLITYQDKDGNRYYGIRSKKKENIAQIHLAACDLKEKAKEGFLIDVLLSNYDVVGSCGSNMFYDTKSEEILRLDPGAALLYRARGKAKKDEFDENAGEYRDMVEGRQIETPFNNSSLLAASKVFNGIYTSPSLLISLSKLLAVPDDKIQQCIEENGFNFDNTDKGQKKNIRIIKRLQQRKQALIQKAENTIVDHLQSNPQQCREYLTKAISDPYTIEQLCSSIEKGASKDEIKIQLHIAILQELGLSASHEIFYIEDALFNQIVKDYLLSQAPQDAIHNIKSYKNNGGDNPILRVKHGGMHACRTTLHTSTLIDLLKQQGYAPAKNLNRKDLFLIKVAAMFHDTGRQKDSGKDQHEWEMQSAQYAETWLKEKGFSYDDCQKVYQAIAFKDNPDVQNKNIYALILAGADSLDWVRSHSSDFQAQFMPDLIKKYIPLSTLKQLSMFAKNIAVTQGDSPRDYKEITGCFDIARKKIYEHSDVGCYTKVKEQYNKFTYIIDKRVNLTYPASYDKITTIPDANNLEKATKLLEDYSKNNSFLSRVIHGHWNRHHVSDVVKITSRVHASEGSKDKIKTLPQLMEALAAIPGVREKGSLNKRINYIRQYLYNMPMESQELYRDRPAR